MDVEWKKLRAAVYCRVSTEEQSQAETIENQVEFARKYCELHGSEEIWHRAEELRRNKKEAWRNTKRKPWTYSSPAAYGSSHSWRASRWCGSSKPYPGPWRARASRR